MRPLVGRYNAKELAFSIIKEKLSARAVENFVRSQKDIEAKKAKPPRKVDSNVLLVQKQIEESLLLSHLLHYLELWLYLHVLTRRLIIITRKPISTLIKNINGK